MPGIMSSTFVLFLLSLFVSHVTSLGATDTITWGGDNSRSGYQTNHNMDPSVVGSAQFGQIFKAALPGFLPDGTPEQIFSQPLVYTTPGDGVQYLYVATTLNNIYKMNAATGAIILKRNLGVPFSKIDIDNCGDISPVIGITGTGVIDPDTDTWYLTAKTYTDQTQTPGVAQGQANGRNQFHSINVNDLSERPGFPIDMEGTVARNNPLRSFGGGIHHQRPALLHVGQYIYAGYGSHCVKFNYTGWIMGWDKTTGAIVERYAMGGAPVGPDVQVAGVWMSGGGLASDDKGSMFFATGNGHASQLSTIPVNGHNPPSALEEAAVHATINADGTITVVDFFMPWEKTQLDGGDRDLGTSPLEILPSEFSCGDVERIGVVTGKEGKTYWLNLDNLGGYQNGANKLDDIIQSYQNENSVYAGAGVYPLEGGYIYINVIQYPTHVFKFSCSNGVPSFTKVADSPENCAYLGVGHGTTTSLNGQVGSGLVWVSDVDGYNLRIYNAVPANGLMTLINHFNIPGITKFTRPVFGNGRAYLGTTQGYLYGFGAPVNSPLNCTSPVQFGTQNLTATGAAQTVTCTAKIAVTVTNITLTGNPNFAISGSPAIPLTLAVGKSFTFQTTFVPTTVGILSSDVVISTTNGVTGYSITTPVSLEGTGQSVQPLLSVSPVTVAFPGSITGNQVGGVNQTVIFINNGNSPLTISSLQYSQISETGPYIAANTSASGFPQVGPFTFYDLPTTIPGNTIITVTINFDTSTSGNFAAYVTVNSDGGSQIFDVVGTSGDAPVALIEFQTPDGLGWTKYQEGMNLTFGNVTEAQTLSLKLRVTNIAPTDSAKLSLTVSKPPTGGILSANNQIDLGEGTQLAPGQNATATLYCSPPKTQWDTDAYIATANWTMNLNDLTFGHQDIPFVCNAVSEQAPPLLPNGTARYRYIGCYKENNPGRQLAKQLYGNDSNTIPMCVSTCAAGNYIFCGTQYNRECWAGPTIPNLKVDDANCNFPCKGDITQVCGGNGITGGGAYISLFADSLQFNGNTTTPTSSSSTSGPTPTGGPYVNPGVLGYTSIGCYTESTTGRALPNGKTMTTRTVASCIAQCAASSYIYAGLEYAQECWCGNAFTAGSVPTAITDCNSPCKDNTTEYCGAGSRLNVYQFNLTVSSSASSSSVSTSSSSSSSSSLPVTSSTSTSTISSSSSSSTVTSTSSSSSSSLTSSTVISSSSSSSSSTFSLSSSSTSISSSSSSSFSSSSSSSSIMTTSSSISSSTSSTSSSSLSSSTTPTSTSSSSSSTSSGSSSSSSISSTSTRSTSSSSSSSSISSPTSTSTSSSSSSSSSTLSTSSSSSSSSSSRSSVSSTSTTSTSSTTPTQTAPAIKQTIDSWTFQGCWTESTTGRALSSTTYANDSMTLESCAAFCRGFSMFGVEYGRECYCGNTLSAGSVKATLQSDCNFLCPGNPLEYCGAGKRLELYSSIATGTSTSTSSPAIPTSPVTSTGNVNFTYYSCISEPSSGRLLPSVIENNGTSMTIEKCLSDCYTYKYAGVEYGRECWCGNSLNLVGNTGATPAANASNAACGFICPGNSTEYCGAGGMMNLYVRLF